MQTFAVCLGVLKLIQGYGTLKTGLEQLEETLHYTRKVYNETHYIGQKVCYIESSTLDGLITSILL